MSQRLIALSSIITLALGVACSSKPKKVTAQVTASPAPTRVERKPAPKRVEVVRGEIAQVILNLHRVHFAFDGVTLEEPAREALFEAAAVLVKHPDIQIRVMGHADERGSEEYNIALGERRARSVVDFLSRLGVAPERLEIVSYGEERPLAQGQDPIAYARNRRVDFDLIRGNARLVLADGEIDQTGEPMARRPKRRATASPAR